MVAGSTALVANDNFEPSPSLDGFTQSAGCRDCFEDPEAGAACREGPKDLASGQESLG